MDILGFDIGGTKCAVLLCDARDDRVIFRKREEIATAPDWEAVLESLCRRGEAMLEEYRVARAGCRIGISCGGPLNRERTVICSPPNLPGWTDVPVVDWLSARLGMPASMQNDADACALAEWKYGAGKGCGNMVFLTFGTGLGAGLILNGRLYAGANGGAGEVGHIRMESDGPTGYGKPGSLEGFCSGGGIRQLAIRQAVQTAQEGGRVSYQKSNPEAITTKDVAEAARLGYEDAREIFVQSGRYFGRGLAVLVDLLNPEVIVAGGVYMRCHDLMEPSMREELKKEALEQNVRVCRIEPSLLGEQIGDYGAVMAAFGEKI